MIRHGPRSWREVLRSAQDDRIRVLLNARNLTHLDAVWPLKQASVINQKIPLILVTAALFAAPATAQQSGAPTLRSESSDQLRQATPDIGVRRAPTANQVPARSPAGNAASSSAPSSELSQAVASPKALSAAEVSSSW